MTKVSVKVKFVMVNLDHEIGKISRAVFERSGIFQTNS